MKEECKYLIVIEEEDFLIFNYYCTYWKTYMLSVTVCFACELEEDRRIKLTRVEQISK